MRSPTRGDRAIDWIEKYCLYPAGPERGQRVRLSQHQREIIRTIYDHPAGRQPRPISSQPLAAYLALLHVCGARRCSRRAGAGHHHRPLHGLERDRA